MTAFFVKQHTRHLPKASLLARRAGQIAKASYQIQKALEKLEDDEKEALFTALGLAKQKKPAPAPEPDEPEQPDELEWERMDSDERQDYEDAQEDKDDADKAQNETDQGRRQDEVNPS